MCFRRVSREVVGLWWGMREDVDWRRLRCIWCFWGTWLSGGDAWFLSVVREKSALIRDA
ncbi:hypothetical protein [Bartonella sp. TT121SHDZB]|uniref:hypothetical protein n=1 Tax=Bartonella sp. TT121SHDZB TaxID=3243580 RepID=UPI0035D05F1D